MKKKLERIKKTDRHSNYSLGLEIGVSEGSIRRYLLELPMSERIKKLIETWINEKTTSNR